MKIALLQTAAILGEPETNYARVEETITEAMREKPDVIVLPELWDVGFLPNNLAACADEEGKRARAFLSRMGKRHHVNIVGGSVLEHTAQGFYNASYSVNRSGRELAAYRKIHLFSPAREHQRFRHGTRLCTFMLEGVKAAVIICYDLRFCELVRLLALEGVQILFVPAAWPQARLEHWKILARARAIENQFFVAAVNSAAVAGNVRFGGASLLVDPWGETLAVGGEKEALLTAQADFSVTAGIREKINVFADRRTEIYSLSRKY